MWKNPWVPIQHSPGHPSSSVLGPFWGSKITDPSNRGAGLANFTSLGSSGNFWGSFSNGMFFFLDFLLGGLLGLVSLGLVWFGLGFCLVALF